MFSAFEIVVVWELDFVKIIKMPKILNNKNCNLLTKPLYRESLSHTCRIWISYDRPTPDLDGSMCHNEKYKVSSLSLLGSNFNVGDLFMIIPNFSFCYHIAI